MSNRPVSIFNAPKTVTGTVVEQEQFNAPVPTSKPANTQLATITEDYIMNLGNDSSKGLTELTSKILSAASSNSGGVMTEKLDELIVTTKRMSIDNFHAGSFKKTLNRVLGIKDKAILTFQNANSKVDTLVKQLEKERHGQEDDRKSIDALTAQNYNYCKAIIAEIDQAKTSLEAVADAMGQYGDNLDVDQTKEFNELQTKYDMLEKKIVDLESNKILSMNMDPKLKLMKQGAISLISTFDNIVNRVVPLYMQQFSAFLLSERQEQATKLSDKTMTMLNEAIVAGSDLAAKNAESIARLNQRQMIDVETLKRDHTNVVESLAKVKEIAVEARANRKAIMDEISAMEQDTIKAFSKK